MALDLVWGGMLINLSSGPFRHLPSASSEGVWPVVS